MTKSGKSICYRSICKELGLLMPKNMSDNYYSDDDYDQEYAEGYSAYKYDNEDYDLE